jgi:DNA replication and repair protein RecF
MWLEPTTFRNLAGSRLQFGEPVALFWGENAQGKTNLLEAVCILGAGVSFRERRLATLVRDGADGASVRGGVRSGGTSHDLEVRIGRGRREALRDGSPCSLPEYVRTLPVVTLSAEDRALVRGEPRARREFLDGSAVLARPAHLGIYQRFARALRQRNGLLRGYDPRRRAELDAWTKAYAELAGEVRLRRADAARRVAEILRELEGEMEHPEKLTLEYLPEEGDLHALLGAGRAEEIRRGHTLHGPHRDGVEIQLGGRPVAAYGSSGQVRTALWMLKLARLLLIRERDPSPPVFLLDDAESELDARRIREMMRLTEGKAQVFLTATGPLDSTWGPMQRFNVRAGEASPRPAEM